MTYNFEETTHSKGISDTIKWCSYLYNLGSLQIHHCSLSDWANLIWVAPGEPRALADKCGRTLSSLVELQPPARWRGLCQIAPSAADSRREKAKSPGKRGRGSETCALPAADRRALCLRSPRELARTSSTRVRAPHAIREPTVSKSEQTRFNLITNLR